MADLYALDSNVYINALRDPARLALLKRFLIRSGTRLRMAAVVAMELRTGARTREQREAVEDLIAPYAERNRVVVPTFEGYVQAGRVLAALATLERIPHTAVFHALRNDVLLAASCREANVVLVSDNAGDFHRIQRHMRKFRFTEAANLVYRSR